MNSRFSRQTLVAIVAAGLTVPLAAQAQQDRTGQRGVQPAVGATQPAVGATATRPAVGATLPALGTTRSTVGTRPAAPATILDTMPEVVERDGVRYLSGGVGLDERDAMRAAARDFNLRLSFARQGSGEYVALVDVAVRDAQGRELIRVPEAGPILLMHLPRGVYNVEATFDGRTQTRQVSIDERMTREYLTWQDAGRPPVS